MTKEVKEKKSRGQPTKYKPEYERQALVLAEKGFTDADVAEVFKVTEQTINNWKKRFPQFFESLKKGKDIADQKVVQSLYQRALGYSHPEIHISNFQGNITKTNIIKHYAPDTAACFIWLKNRAGWRDKQEIVTPRTETEQVEVDGIKERLKALEDAGDGIPSE